MKALHANMTIITWFVMSYMLSITILVPTIGRIADISWKLAGSSRELGPKRTAL